MVSVPDISLPQGYAMLKHTTLADLAALSPEERKERAMVPRVGAVVCAERLKGRMSG